MKVVQKFSAYASLSQVIHGIVGMLKEPLLKGEEITITIQTDPEENTSVPVIFANAEEREHWEGV